MSGLCLNRTANNTRQHIQLHRGLHDYSYCIGIIWSSAYLLILSVCMSRYSAMADALLRCFTPFPSSSSSTSFQPNRPSRARLCGAPGAPGNSDAGCEAKEMGGSRPCALGSEGEWMWEVDRDEGYACSVYARMCSSSSQVA